MHQPIQLARQWFDKNFTLRGLFTLIVLIFCAVPDWKSRGEYWEQILYWDAIKTFVFSGWGRFTIICIGALIIWLDHRTVIKRKNRTPSQANAKHDWNVGAKPRELRIKSAIYGVGDSRYKDVTPQIKAHIKDNRIHLLVCNDTLLSGADPYYKERKHLIVEYSLGGGLTEEIVRQEQDYLELPEGNEPKQPEQDDPLCKALKAIAAEDAEKIWTKLHECGWRAEFHNPGFDPYLDIFIDLLNASIFEMVTVGKIDGHGSYDRHPLAAPPRIVEHASHEIGPPLVTVKRGEKETIIIRQPLSVEMADRMWAEKSIRMPLKFAGVSISFNTIGVMAPKHFSWFGVPEITVDKAKRL